MIILNNPKGQLIKQLNSLYSLDDNDRNIIETIFPVVITKMEKCFCYIKNKYYHENNSEVFDALHVAQWTMFLYMMAKQACISSGGGHCAIKSMD